jgi:hypothetical protein
MVDGQVKGLRRLQMLEVMKTKFFQDILSIEAASAARTAAKRFISSTDRS